MLTFNPGWGQHGRDVDDFADVRELQRELKKCGISLANEADEGSTAPAS